MKEKGEVDSKKEAGGHAKQVFLLFGLTEGWYTLPNPTHHSLL